MAFTLENLGPLGGQSRSGVNSAQFVYNNKDGDTVTGAGYFDDVYTKFAPGDILEVVNYAAAVPSALVRYLVTASASTGVTILAV